MKPSCPVCDRSPPTEECAAFMTAGVAMAVEMQLRSAYQHGGRSELAAMLVDFESRGIIRVHSVDYDTKPVDLRFEVHRPPFDGESMEIVATSVRVVE